MMVMMGSALLVMWLLGLVFHIGGIFVWFLLGWGIIALALSRRLSENM